MKSIGTTPDGGRIVEMTRDEFSEFAKLKEAVTGATDLGVFSHEPFIMIEYDFANVFHVIRFYYLNHLQINNMQSLLDLMKETLNKKEPS